MTSADDRVRTFLRDRGAARIPHPGGTLLGHLERTAERLQSWGAADSLRLAGLVHSAYGTDGFGTELVTPDDRTTLTQLVGPDAEEVVHVFSRCDRDRLAAELASVDAPSLPRVHDRETGELLRVDADGIHDLLELTFANELDLVEVNRGFAANRGPELAAMFVRCETLVSPSAYAEFLRLLGPTLEGRPPTSPWKVRVARTRLGRRLLDARGRGR